MAYAPTTFNNGAAPGISAEELNKFGTGIKAAHDTIDAATDLATASTLVKRDGGGRAHFSAPIVGSHAARKSDLDTLSLEVMLRLSDIERTVSMGGMI